jgi:hypothetical protein
MLTYVYAIRFYKQTFSIVSIRMLLTVIVLRLPWLPWTSMKTKAPHFWWKCLLVSQFSNICSHYAPCLLAVDFVDSSGIGRVIK